MVCTFSDMLKVAKKTAHLLVFEKWCVFQACSTVQVCRAWCSRWCQIHRWCSH